MFSAHDVAVYIINWCHQNKIPITNLKLQKLLYYVQGEFSRYRKRRLIADDFYAWQLGPVIPDVYTEYSIFSSAVIPAQKQTQSFCQEDLDIINLALEKYAHESTWNLVELSHHQDPWKYNYEIFGNKSLIPYETIRSYFSENKGI